MTRRRLPLEFVANNAARKAIFTKRKKGLFKKASELSTLCDINVCFVIWSMFDKVPEVWPPSDAMVHDMLRNYKEVPEMERAKRRTSLEDYIKGRVAKAQAQKMELIRDTREKELTLLMYRCLSMEIPVSSLPLSELKNLRYIIDDTLGKIHKRIEMLEEMEEKGAAAESTQLLQPQGESPPVDQSLPVQPMMTPDITLLLSDDEVSAADETINPIMDNDFNFNFTDLYDSFWPEIFDN
ncbi:hypothetical protein MLD38_020697 [Melastoma candidum]|uniref:Uncharacterized protein n=1 Tax=Melastoma candidum TaxID=119954 RepID=A0ACB9QDA1_9MYRT|nr:hypothetical protein MLD38_020697 [Melastoma candidum]